jgi:hypothetical protein
MKGGSIVCWRTVVGVVGSTYPGAALLPRASVGLWESRAEGPCSAGIRSERVEALGAAGRTSLFACGRLGRRDERARQALQYIPRSLVSAPAVHHRVSRWRRSAAGGVAAPNCCVAERRSENLGVCQLWKENHRGVKIIPAQIYTGVDNLRR